MPQTYLPSEIPQEWRDLLLLIPGYNSISTAGDAWFDAVRAQLAIDFFPACLTHVEGALAGRPFILEPWQKSFIANLFGWKRKDEFGREVRRYRETLLYVSRKNGKSPLCAGIAMLVFFTDKTKGQQGYIAAGEKEQAGLLFRQAKGMVEAQPRLESRCKIFGGNAPAGQSKSIVRENDNSYVRVISADAPGKHGGNTHLAIIDELHVQPNRDLVDVFQTSFASANMPEPLFICLTTADYDRPSVCNEKYDYACKVRDGVIEDQSYLPVIYELTKEDAWDKEENWLKANPNLGVSVSMDFLRRECKRAKEIPAYENTFRRLHLNQRTTTAETCISIVDWDACIDPLLVEPGGIANLIGRECHASLDIGATSDFTAMVRLFPHDDAEEIQVPIVPGEKLDVPEGEPVPLQRTVIRRSYTALCTLWLPENRVKRNHRMDAQIDAWIKQGFIRVTSGSSVDYDLILDEIVQLLEPYQLIDFAFDRGFQGGQMGTNLIKHFGLDKVFMFPQGILSMAAPFREFIELLPVRRIHHEGNPAVRWMVSNVVAERKGGLVKPSKDKSTEKIDVVTAFVMAIGRALFAVQNTPYSCYDKRGIVTL